MLETNPISSPMVSGSKLSTQGADFLLDPSFYRSIVALFGILLLLDEIYVHLFTKCVILSLLLRNLIELLLNASQYILKVLYIVVYASLLLYHISHCILAPLVILIGLL